MQDVSPTASDTKVCPFCAETIKAEAKVCRFCGRDLVATSEPPVKPKYDPPQSVVEKKKNGWFGGCLKVVGAIVLLLVGLTVLGTCLGGGSRITSTGRSAAVSSGARATPTLTAAQLQGRAVSVPFDDLARNTEQHEGKLLELTGTVIQVLEDGNEAQLRVNINGDYDQTVFVQYPGYSKARVLEGDDVKMVALVEGRITYEAVLGNEVTLPALTALWLEVLKK